MRALISVQPIGRLLQTRLLALLVLVIAAAVVVSACGGGDDDDAADTAAAETDTMEPDTDDPDTIDDPQTEQSEDGESVSVRNPDASDEDEPPAGEEATPPPTDEAGIEILSLEGDGDGDGDGAQSGDSVAVWYRGTLDNGEEFDSNHGGDLLPVTIGSGGVIDGFDQALRGLKVGQTITVRIPALLAYGIPTAELILEFPREQTPPGMEVGQAVQLGNGVRATIIEINDDVVVVDGNHDLAGEALTFGIELVEFR